MKILLVEDEPGLILTLTDRLVSEGFDVTSAADGKAGFETAIAGKFDLMILDVMLPKKNGYDVARDLRQKGVETPIEVIELLARIEALLRRSPNQTNGTTADVFRFGTVTIDFKRAEVSKGKARVDLSAMEFKLLHYLIENRGNVHSRDHLLDAVWGYGRRSYSLATAKTRGKPAPPALYPDSSRSRL